MGLSSSGSEAMSGMMEICGGADALAPRSSTPKSASVKALFRGIGLDCSVSVSAGTVKVGSSGGGVWDGQVLGDSMLSTTAFSSAFAFATCSLVAARGEAAAALYWDCV